MAFVSKLTGLLLTIVFLAGCNSGENTRGDKQVFLLDDFASVSLVVEDVIEQSGIKKKGYVAIIPDQSESAKKNAKKLRQEFYKKEIMAVHILSINPAADLLRTDVITIENARIICLLNWEIPADGQEQLEKSLSNTVKAGSCFVVNNKETEQTLLRFAVKP